MNSVLFSYILIQYIFSYTHSVVTHRFYGSVQKFAIKYDLGRAICGNIFLGEWDESVDRGLKKVKRPFPGFLVRHLTNLGLAGQIPGPD